MSKLQEAEPFTPDQLSMLEAALDPQLVAWAADKAPIAAPGEGNRLIMDLAALHAHGKVMLGVIRMVSLELGGNTGEEYHAPRELAGRAAGQLSVGMLMMKWYGLEAADLAKYSADGNALVYSLYPPEELQNAVSTMPKALGITAVSSHDIFVETMFSVQEAYDEQGRAALEPYTEIAHYVAR